MKEVEGSNCFGVTWSPSLLGDQSIKNNKLIFTYKYVVTHTYTRGEIGEN